MNNIRPDARRHFLRYALIINICFLLPVCFAVRGFARNEAKPAADDPAGAEARRLWELAIEAKGGRERLEAIRNMVVSGENHLYLLGFRVRRNRQPKYVTFYSFPDKFWEWDDNRPSIFGLLILMKNYETNMYYCAPNHIRGDRLQPLDVESDGRVWMKKQYLDQPQLITFMETKWIKPVPVRAAKGYLDKKWVKIIAPDDRKKHKHPVDIVQTHVLDGRVDFVLDAQTHLPVRIGFYMRWYANSYGGHDEQVNTDEVYWICRIEKYAEVDGIKIPSAEETEVRFNVDYNKDIFSVPTTVEDGPDAWKPKK